MIISDGGNRRDFENLIRVYRQNRLQFRTAGVRESLTRRSVESCRSEQGVRQGAFQILESEPYGVERAAHPLARIDTDRRSHAVRELSRDRR